jgi:hypothetical protein
VWRCGACGGGRGKGGEAATATHPLWLPPHRHTRDRALDRSRRGKRGLRFLGPPPKLALDDIEGVTVKGCEPREKAHCSQKVRASRGYDIHTGQPTGREVQAMHRLQVLEERYIAEGLTPADAQTRAREELRANPRKD